MEAALALVAVGRAGDLAAGAVQAGEAIDRGAARRTLAAWAQLSHAGEGQR